MTATLRIMIYDLHYPEYSKVLKSNPILIARHFQYRVEVY